MKVILRNKFLSLQRFNRYLIASGNDNQRAKRLYAANIKLAQAFHPLLSQFEVILRNALNNHLSRYFSDPEWIINQATGFMSHSSLARSRFYLRTCVQKTENDLLRRGIPITAGKIISDQTFGFLLAFFVPHHYALVHGQSIYVFPYRPITENRSSIHNKLDIVKNYRNRMNHCEPLCFRGNAIDCAEALAVRSAVYDLVTWIEPDLISYFESIDNIRGKINQIMRI